VFTLDGRDTITVNNTVPAPGLTAMNFDGGNDADHFIITPSATIPYTLEGGDPTPPSRPGDSLDINFTGTTGALFTSLPGQGAGKWTFTNRKTITYDGIEDVPGLQVVVTGTDFGQASRVRVYGAQNHNLLLDFNPFSDIAGYKAGDRVAAADINGDYIPDIIV